VITNIIRWLAFSGLYILLALLSFHVRDSWTLSAAFWLPAPLLFAALWLTYPREWLQWLITAAVLHVFVGVGTGRPVLMACLFTFLDLAILPLCVAIFRLNARIPALSFTRKPIMRELIYPLQLMLCIFCGSQLLNLTLLLAGYPITSLHFLSRLLAALTGVAALLPLLQDDKTSPQQRNLPWRECLLLAMDTLLLLAFYFFLPHWQGLNLLLAQTTVVFLSIFVLSGRSVGVLLLIQYLVVVLATEQREGIFYNLTPDLIPAILQAQCYLGGVAILANCLYQYLSRVKKQQMQASSTCALITGLTQTGVKNGVTLLFHLTMPEEDIHWRDSTETLFPGEEKMLSNLTLLDAHCSTPFLPFFRAWYLSQQENSFRQEVTLHTLHGRPMRGVVVFQRITNDLHLIGGLSMNCCDLAEV